MRRTRRTSTVAAAAGVLALAVMGCGGGEDDAGVGAGVEAVPSSRAPATSVDQREEQESGWFDETDSPDAIRTAIEQEQPDEDGDPVSPETVSAPDEDGVSPPVDPLAEGEGRTGDDDTDPALDPCSLVPHDDWRAWVGDPQVEQVEIEPGQVCGYYHGGDRVRMGLGYFEGTGWLEDGDAGEPVAGLGRSARWVPRHPIPQSSVLVVQLDGAELVIELAARSHTAGPLREAAVGFARTAIGNLP